jgi:hypothetical protein
MLPVNVVRSVLVDVPGCGVCAVEAKKRAMRNKAASHVKCSLLLGQGCDSEKENLLSPDWAVHQGVLLETLQ